MKNIDTVINQYTELLDEKRLKCRQKCDSLTKDNRKDEADLEKIKINIYDIFATFIGVIKKQISAKNYSDESLEYEVFCSEYIKTFDKIPESWRVKLQKAKEINAVIDIVIEETKLSIASELKNVFTDLCNALL